MTEYTDLIQKIAKSFYVPNSIYDLEDLIQVGYIGVIKGLRSYKSNEDLPMEDFISINIKNEINRFISRFKLELNTKKKDIDLDKLISKYVKELDILDMRKLTDLEKSIIVLKCDGYTRKEICDIKYLTKNEYYSVFLSAIGKIVNEE